MSTALIGAGCAVVLLGIVLLIAAVVAFLAMRRRSASPASTTAGASPISSPPPASPAPRPAPATAATEREPEPTVRTVNPPEMEPTVAIPIEPLARFEWTSGPLAGRTFSVPPEGVYIGRDGAQSQVVLADSRISKRHLWLGRRDGIVVAVDAGSTNGTALNSAGRRVTDDPLEPGDELIFPEELARLRYLG